MTRKHGIRAPRKPRGESAAVTISNQDKQIKLLIDRCATLEKDNRSLIEGSISVRDAWDEEALLWQKKYQEMQDEIASYRLAYEAITEAAQRMRGWQDLAREILVPMFPSSAPGL